MAALLPTEDLSDPTKPPTTVVAQAARTGNCHICQQPVHWSAKCPHCKKTIPTRPQQTTTPKFDYSSHIYNQPPGYQPYCPIVVAPNFLPYGPPYPYSNNFSPSHFLQKPVPPCPHITQHKSNTPNDRPYESYKPNYAKRTPPVTARNVDVGTFEDEIAKLQIAGKATGDAISTNTKIILDTGASSHLTCDRSALFDFQVLKTPIPLRVAMTLSQERAQ
jgi:hypothetical protein